MIKWKNAIDNYKKDWLNYRQNITDKPNNKADKYYVFGYSFLYKNILIIIIIIINGCIKHI